MKTTTLLAVQFWVGLLAVLLTAGDLSAVRVGDVDVTPLTTYTGSDTTRHGYREYRVALFNTSDEQAGVLLQMPGPDSWSSGQRIERLTRSVVLAPKARTVVSLYQPAMPMRPELTIRSNGQMKTVPFNGPGHERPHRHHGDQTTLLLSQGIDPRSENRLDRATSRYLTPYSADVPTNEWSDASWLSFSVFDGVVISSEELTRMKPALRENLRRYVMLGGTLHIVGQTPLPPAWARTAVSDGHQQMSLGFGRVVLTAAQEPGLINTNDAVTSVQVATQAGRPFDRIYEVSRANDKLPVIDDLGIPRRGLLLLMVLFALTIGPLNLVILHRKKKQIWLLWTVPAISLVFCLAVWGYATAAEGFSGRERTATITVLDQTEQVAATIGWAGFYSPLTPGGGLRFDLTTELTAQANDQWNDGDGRGRTLHWGDDQHLSSGWITARVPAHFQVRKAQDTLLRLAIHRDAGGTLSVTNGLGVPIRTLYIADHDGNLYQPIQSLGAGQKIEPVVHGRLDAQRQRAEDWNDLFVGDWLGQMDRVQGRPTHYLRPGTFIAILEDEPFLESGLDDEDDRESESVVLGIFAPPTTPTAGGQQ